MAPDERSVIHINFNSTTRIVELEETLIAYLSRVRKELEKKFMSLPASDFSDIQGAAHVLAAVDKLREVVARSYHQTKYGSSFYR